MIGVTIYRPKGRVVLRRIGEDRLLVPVSGDVAREPCVFPVNETGEFIWARILEGRTLDETAAGLAEAFEVTLGEAMEDVCEFAGALQAHHLIEEVTP